MNKKVWYISKYALSPSFGNPTRQFFISKYLKKLGLNVTLICSQSNPFFRKNHKEKKQKTFKVDEQEVEIIYIEGKKINLGFNIKRMLSWLMFEINLFKWVYNNRKDKPEVIIVSSLSILTFVSGIILKKIFNCKLICEVRDIYPLTLIAVKGWSKYNPLVFVLSSIEKLGYYFADSIVGTMPNLRQHVAEVLPSCKNKVVYIPMGVDLEYYENQIQKTDIFNNIFQSNNAENFFIIGYSGTIGYANCVNELLQVAILLKDMPIKFFILGDGPLKHDLQQFSQKNKLNNVVFLDAVEKKCVNSFLSKCDVLINPWKNYNQLYKFGVSPNKWIDYMYSSKPIIVSLSGYHHIINDANCGVFLEANDIDGIANEIIKFSKKSKLELKEIGNNGYIYLTHNLNYTLIAQQYFNIINSLNNSK